ncbi:MAG: hypothetical protein RR604_03055 [Eubacterium sp.]
MINVVPIETRHEMGKKMNAAVKDNIVKQCGQDIYDFVMNEIDKERKSAE